jgi:ketosteroid isomerase-like protein
MKIPYLAAAFAALIPCAVHAEPAAPDYTAELISADTAFSAQAGKVGVLRAFMDVATTETKLLSEKAKGFDAVRSSFKGTPASATLTWKPSFASASAAGDLGYTWGRYEYRDRAADGRPVVETGTYVTIWRRQADGTWRVALDGGQPDPKAP